MPGVSFSPIALQPLRSIQEDQVYVYYDDGPDGPDSDLEDTEAAFEKATASTSSFYSPRRVRWKCSYLQCDCGPLSRPAMYCRTLRRPFFFLVGALGFITLISFAWDSLVSFLAESRETGIFPGQPPSLFSDWLTQGVIPVACHSHNDYWRRVPLFSALAAGCISVEADIWLDGDDLRVGHTLRTVLPGQTLRTLYLNPLLDILERHNQPPTLTTTITTSSNSTSQSFISSPSPNLDLIGVFATNTSQSLTLLIDFKASPDLLWPILIKQLQPLREKGYLTHFNGFSIIQRPLTIVVTGAAPFPRIRDAYTYRDIFYDAPLDDLATDSPYNASNSYYASVDFHRAIGALPLGRLSQDQLAKVRGQIDAAHAHGLKVRYWGTPKWPVGLRNYVWKMLVREGVDVLNVDDLHSATRGDWKERGWWR
ncbi:hypothetical protein N7462_001448 [Penicillium macrosclerotiorum]|uniref:uncharacterized protein n=1 Tax=Penicillium macrosclerotiorum TaxID=303699 RepID=UPI0025472AAB|nr:uncharacterized protein N7462_001448 [Penicillium macrosclerotiorum]KAJ5692025.1 hypothetical protein N7462_001448 [Penicillium macrosclerotiorum]